MIRVRPVLTSVFAVLALHACQPSGQPGSVEPDRAAQVVYAPTNRPDVRGSRGAVSAGHPLAAQAGLQALHDGGNAVDAALTMAAVLAVVRPHMNGVGGDAFVFVWEAATREVHALNGSGRSGALATPDFFRGAGLDEVPERGGKAVSVPGAVAAWIDVHERFGTRDLTELLAPAIHYAREGFPVSARLAADIAAQGGPLNTAGKAQYMPGGAPPPVGSLFKNPALARTLERIAAHGKDGFYTGPVADRIARFVAGEGGHIRAADLAAHTSTWVDPLRAEYLGHDFLVFPPNTQGLAQLQLFTMARSHDLERQQRNSAPYLHTLIELKKLAFADRDRWAGDPEHMDLPVDQLLDPGYLGRRARLISPEMAAREVPPGIGDALPEPADTDDSGDTVYLTVVDADGNAVSWIQSLYAGFGSGLFEPETGVMLHNRGALYTLQDGHPNQVAPHTRPYHTLTPMMVLRDGDFAFTMGTPGGDSQPQTLIQIVNNLLVFGMSPQAAIEAPRFRSYGGVRVDMEDRMPAQSVARMRAMGHDIRLIPGWTATFGGAQMIMRDPESGTLVVGSDPRREAYGLAW